MLIDEFVGHSKGVTSMATAAGGRLLATCSADGSARIWNVDQAKQLHAYQPAKAAAAVTNYLSPPPSLLLLSEHRAGMPLPKGHDQRGTATANPPFALLHVVSGALISCLEVMPPAVRFARASDVVVRAQLIDSCRGVSFGPDSSSLLLTAANNTLQLVSQADGLSQGIFAPGRLGRRMLGMTQGSSSPQLGESGSAPPSRGPSPTGGVTDASAGGAGVLDSIDHAGLGGCVYVPEIGCSIVCWADGSLGAIVHMLAECAKEFDVVDEARARHPIACTRLLCCRAVWAVGLRRAAVSWTPHAPDM